VVTGPGPVRKRRRASTVNYKQLAGLNTRNRRSKEEIMKEKAEKEDKRESRAKKTRRLHAETAEGSCSRLGVECSLYEALGLKMEMVN
jgi:hypothetical protein